MRFLVLGLTLVSVAAVAQDGGRPIEGVRSPGCLVNGAKAEFHAGRFKNADGREAVRGESKFEIAAGNDHPPVLIECRVSELRIDGTKAKFGGNAVLTTIDANRKRIHVKGMANVTVNDLHKPDGGDKTKDAYAIQFDDKAGHNFQFGGNVDRGDLVVKAKG